MKTQITNSSTNHLTPQKFKVLKFKIFRNVSGIFLGLSTCVYICTLGFTPIPLAEAQTVVAVDAIPQINAAKIKGGSVIVQNLTTGKVLFERNADEARPLASLSKLMTAITVKKIQENWKILPTRIQLLSKLGLSEVDRAVRGGGYMKINDLVSYMLLSSSNNAADSLTHELIPFSSFMAYMNHTAQALGLENSHFVNGSGLTEESSAKKSNALSILERNSISSAKDVLKILNEIVKSYPELASITRVSGAHVTSTSGKKIPITNTNKLLDSVSNIYLGKTGFTEDAGGNLAIVIEKNGYYYGIVVMGSTIDGRFEDVSYLASAINSL